MESRSLRKCPSRFTLRFMPRLSTIDELAGTRNGVSIVSYETGTKAVDGRVRR